MIKTVKCSVFALFAAGLVALSGTAQDKQPQPAPKPVGGQKVAPFLECAQVCDDCARVCNECNDHCAKLVADGQKHHQITMRTCQDCAAICSTTSAILSRHGPFSDTMLVACAQACKRCGDECEKHGGDDPTMKRCAAECRRCEKACLEMLKNSGRDPNAPPGK